MENIAASLRAFIIENFLFGAEQAIAEEDSLLELGIVDSTGVLELIMHLEDTYGMEIADEELLPENLDSIANLTRFINSKVGASVGTT